MPKDPFGYEYEDLKIKIEKEMNGCHSVEDIRTGERFSFWDWIRWNFWYKDAV